MLFLAVLTKELHISFGFFLAYAVLAVALALSGFFFYTDLSLFMLFGGTDLEKGLWEFVFHDLRFVLMLLVPVLTARAFAEEQKLGTLDLLWTYPVSESSVLLGKFVASAVLLVIVLVLTLLYPLALSWYYPAVNWFPLLAFYLGLFLLGLAFISVGLLLSATTDSQAIAALGTLGVLVLFWSLTWNEHAVNEVLLNSLLHISLFDRFSNFSRGAIDSHEVTFFLVFVSFFLVLTWQALRSRRWRGKGEFASLRTFLTTPNRNQWLMVGFADVVLLLGLIGLQVSFIPHNVRWDLTPTKAMSLSPQTKALLSKLDREVRATLFFADSPDVYQALDDVLKRYATASPHFQYQVLFRERHLAVAQAYGVTHNNMITIEYDGQRKLVPLVTEQRITQVLFQLIHRQRKTIYFSSGHGEKDPHDNSPRQGYSEAAVALRNENFDVQTLQLGRESRIPQEATVVIVSGPQSDLLTEEIELLHSYIQRGGHVLLMIDPLPVPHLTAALARYGIKLTEDVVYDPENRLFGGDARSPLVSLYNLNVPIVNELRQNTIFPLVRSVDVISPPSPAITVTPFCSTGPGSWARYRSADIAPRGAVEFEGTKARPGPIDIAVAVSLPVNGSTTTTSATTLGLAMAPQHQARIVVYGDSDFASNARLALLGNKDLFLNTVHWLAGEEQFMTERPSDDEVSAKVSPVTLTAQAARQLFWLVAIIEPGVILLIGVMVSVYRKRRM